MKIAELVINNRIITFTNRYNLIYSFANGTGKTTLIRNILYSMGFKIPSTRNVNFNKLETKILIYQYNTKYIIIRYSNRIKMFSFSNGHKKELIKGDVSKNVKDICSFLFNTSNLNIINNVLGCFYFDQDKGWTLLNRGTVIGKYKFNIGRYVQAFIPRKLNSFRRKVSNLKIENKFYKHLELLIQDSSNMKNHHIMDSENKLKINSRIDIMNVYINKLHNQINQLESVKNSNNKFVHMLSNLGITVRENNISIPVNNNTIVNYDINQDIIRARLNNLYSQYNTAVNKRITLTDKSNQLFNPVSYADKLNKYISNMNLSNTTIDEIINQNDNMITKLNKDITDILNNSKISSKLFKFIKIYSKYLGVYKYIDNTDNFIYTKKLKKYSGSILHLLVFAFRLAYLTILERKCNIYPFIILDSPQSGELSKGNAERMFGLLNKYFKNNQIIVASIHSLNKYDFWNKNKDNSIINMNGKFYNFD